MATIKCALLKKNAYKIVTRIAIMEWDTFNLSPLTIFFSLESLCSNIDAFSKDDFFHITL